jgi:hypothetical protein
MSLFVVAGFPNQFAAGSIVDKLLSRGIHRDRIATSVDPREAVASPVVSELDRVGRTNAAKHARNAAPTPAEAGHVMVAVEIDNEMSQDDLCWFLETAGAESLSVLDEGASGSRSGEPPSQEAAVSIDVERAICATRRGEPLGPHTRH